MWLDDGEYFVKTKARNTFLFNVGLGCAIVAWSLWAIAGYTIKDTDQSYSILIYSIAFLTLWILCDAADNRSFREGRPLFLLLNLLYIGVLSLMICDRCSLPFDKKYLTYLLLLGAALDFFFSGSLKQFKED
jgi:hypothetical protein